MKSLHTSLLGLVLLAGSTGTWAAVLEVRSQVNAVGLGEAFDVDVLVSGLETEDVAGFDLDLAFDPGILDFVDYALGANLTDPVLGQLDLSAGETSPGSVNLAEVSALIDFTGQPDAFLLATLSFTGIAEGASALTLARVDLSDPVAFPISMAAVTDGRVTVPGPGTLLLLPIGAGLLLMRRLASR